MDLFSYNFSYNFKKTIFRFSCGKKDLKYLGCIPGEDNQLRNLQTKPENNRLKVKTLASLPSFNAFVFPKPRP